MLIDYRLTLRTTKNTNMRISTGIDNMLNTIMKLTRTMAEIINWSSLATTFNYSPLLSLSLADCQPEHECITDCQGCQAAWAKKY